MNLLRKPIYPFGSSPDWCIQIDWRALLIALGTSLLLSGYLMSGCIMIEPEGPVDADGEPILLPEPGDRWLTLEAVNPPPGHIEGRPTFTFTFSDYIDPRTFLSYHFATLRSGGAQIAGTASFRMVDKSVVWRPSRSLEDGLNYQLKLEAEIRSATRAPFWPRSSPREPLRGYHYFTGDFFEDAPPEDGPTPEDDDASQDSADSTPETKTTPDDPAPLDPPIDAPLPNATWADVEPVFEARCATCHQDSRSNLNPLNYASLVGKRSAQVDRYLVRPADPASSYLLQKLLWDYPDIKFTAQPPPWSADARPLEREELLLIEGWIAHGARK